MDEYLRLIYDHIASDVIYGRCRQAGRIPGSDVVLRDGGEQTAQGVHSGAVAAAEPLL